MALLEEAPGEARHGAMTQGGPCAPELHPQPQRSPPAGTVVRLGGETSLGAPGAADVCSPFPSPHPTPRRREDWIPGPRAPLLRGTCISLVSRRKEFPPSVAYSNAAIQQCFPCSSGDQKSKVKAALPLEGPGESPSLPPTACSRIHSSLCFWSPITSSVCQQCLPFSYLSLGCS